MVPGTKYPWFNWVNPQELCSGNILLFSIVTSQLSFHFILQEISDFLTEPFRQPGRPGAAPTAGSSVGATLPAPTNNGSNAVEGMGRSLDALSLNTAPSVAANQSQDPSFPHLKEKPWFYGAITRAECDNLLNQYGQDGDFLVRSSETNVNFLPLPKHSWTLSNLQKCPPFRLVIILSL